MVNCSHVVRLDGSLSNVRRKNSNPVWSICLGIFCSNGSIVSGSGMETPAKNSFVRNIVI
ncbi:hypothetical protein DERF_010563 [Dermatophagoides farinae]|uniref:Uncharacterized protein n=1 Tax=Dermatophagoides farinae TaxID=6954 RepID=A0A922L3N7_DERFA|nr:hypothetical protein DERF_010563 [Dermatophagoides farinae]